MENKVNFMPAINFINLLHTRRDEGNLKNKPESRKMKLQFFSMNFGGCISFILSQNAYLAFILDHL